MTDIQPCEVTHDARLGIGLQLARTEPSHIHIRRPSRISQPALPVIADEAVVPAQLEVALEDAA